MSKRARQQRILELISANSIATQQELADQLARVGLAATQSSISRDIVELELTKINGFYALPASTLPEESPIQEIETAGANLLVIKTSIGQAQPIALKIDTAKILEIVGTVAGDDTILVAVKNETAQRVAIKKILRVFAAQGRNRSRHAATARTDDLWIR